MNEKIGFVGVGRMGGNMARQLKDCGYNVTAVYDVHSSGARELAAEIGATPCTTLAQVTAQSDVVITVVTDDAAQLAVFAESGDSLLTAAQGKTFINCATLTPAIHVEVERRAKKSGALTLEGCMASSIPQARNGTLCLMCGGDHAVFEPALYCYHCEFCLSGHHNVCANLRFMSNPGEPGFFREIANIPVRNLIAIPATLGLEQATLVEPLAVALHSMQFAALQSGETAAVFGVGPIGLLTVIVLKLAGAGRVWAIDPVAHRLELARAVGADAVIDSMTVDPVQQILKETGGRGVDVAIDCGGKDGSINQCINATCNAGRVVVTAIPSEILVPLAFHPLRRKEIVLFNVRRSNHESAAALEILLQHTARFARLITHTRPLEDIGGAFALLEKYEDGVGKIVITP